MDTSQKVPWLRIFAEGGAIVVSILLAFSIDAWWDEKQEREEVHELLSSVLDDFKNSKTWVDSRRNFATARQESIEELFRIAYGKSAVKEDIEVDGLLRDVGWFQSEVPVLTSALDALITSGKIGLISNIEVRRMLSDWPGDIEWLRTQFVQDYDYWWEYWLPIIKEKGYYPQIIRAHDRVPGNPNPRVQTFSIAPAEEVDHSKLLVDKEFHNVLWIGWSVQADVLYAIDYADEQLDKSIQLLKMELNR